MQNDFLTKNLREEVRVTNFRSWKSGKRWFYASSLVLGLAAGGALVAPSITASADSAQPVAQIEMIQSPISAGAADAGVAATSPVQQSYALGPQVAGIVTKDVTLPVYGTWDPSSAFVSALDSDGQAVSQSDIQLVGTVNTRVPGQYVVNYSFNDKNTGAAITRSAVYTVSKQIESASAVTRGEATLVTPSSVASSVSTPSTVAPSVAPSQVAAQTSSAANPFDVKNISNIFGQLGNTVNSLASSVATNGGKDLSGLLGGLGSTVNSMTNAANSAIKAGSSVAGSSTSGAAKVPASDALSGLLGFLGSSVNGLTGAASSAISSLTGSSAGKGVVSSVASSAAKTNGQLVAPNLSAFAKTAEDAYNMTLSKLIASVISAKGAANAINLFSTILTPLSSLLSPVPGASSVVTVLNSALGAAKQALDFASKTGLDPMQLVTGAIDQGINLIGSSILGIIQPVLSKIPLIGSVLTNAIKPILSNLSKVSPAVVVKSMADSIGLGGLLSLASGINATVAPVIIGGLQIVLNVATQGLNILKSLFGPFIPSFGSLFNVAKSLLEGLLIPVKSVFQFFLGAAANVLKGGFNLLAPSLGSTVSGLFKNGLNFISPLLGSGVSSIFKTGSSLLNPIFKTGLSGVSGLFKNGLNFIGSGVSGILKTGTSALKLA